MTDAKPEHDVDYAGQDEGKPKVWDFILTWKVEAIPEVKLASGEEEEECIFKVKCKLYRLRDG